MKGKKFILEAFGENEADVIDAENAAKIEEALSRFVQTDVPLKIECEFVGEEEIRRLNAEMRGVDKITDVLSFPELESVKGKPIKKAEHPFETDEDGALVVGSLAVCAKSGTAEAAPGQSPHAWFAGFVADEDLPLAFVVLVENGGGGADAAGPIAARLLAQAAEAAE